MNDAPAMTAPADGVSPRWEDNAAFWIRIIREHRDRYRTELTDQAVLEAIGQCEGRDMLDAGCGEGYLARELANRGAQSVMGFDKSHALVAAARESSAGQRRVHFYEADAASLPFSDASCDVAVANHLLNDLPDIGAPVNELARVLRPSGLLVILMLHPCFYGHRAERQAVRRSLPVTEYFAARAIEQHFSVDGITSPAPTISWVRPLEAYTNALTKSGFAITGLTEPHPTEVQLRASAWWRDSFPRPLFLLITARKEA